MYCNKCGQGLSDGDLFCPKCGKQVNPSENPSPKEQASIPEKLPPKKQIPKDDPLPSTRNQTIAAGIVIVAALVFFYFFF